MSEVKRHSVSGYGRQDICYNDPEGEFVYHEDYAAIKAERDALATEAVIKGWVACSPEWIERNGACSCETAPRIAFGDIGPHYHPPTFAQANDAYLNSVRAEGVDYVAGHLDALQRNMMISSNSLREYAVMFRAGEFAAQLRAGKDGE